MDLRIDLTTAPAGAPDFSVRSELALQVTDDAVGGLWVDFIGLAVDRVSIDGAPVPVQWDGARIELPRLECGARTVVIRARGLYSKTGQGLHRFYDPVDGATYLYTHFEPSDARRAWPCLDQPDLKAPLTLTVRHPRGWIVLANGMVDSTDSGSSSPSSTLTRFTTTAPLPSYLTALVAGPWHRVSGWWRSALRPDDDPVPLSWCCRASLAEHLDTDELLETTRSGMDLYDEAYDFPYPWGSYDCILVPEYNIGAMENPGCVTFSEDSYLFRGPVTRAQRARRANTILHEMCHMWFGDLVTPRWWEDIWLKESFADHQGTWAQASCTPYTDAWVSFASTRKAWAYLEDARPTTTHPIVADVADVEAARQAFDGITYAKGAAVLKQLAAHLGQDAFRAAARTWFRERAFSNGDLIEFLSTLSRAAGRDMKTWADAWLRTSGPSVLTDEVEVADGRITRLTVRQSCTDPVTGRPVIRPHTLVVGLYSFDSGPNGALVRTRRLPVELKDDSAEVHEAIGLPAPDLITVNDEDLTYAVVRPDPASLVTARTSLGRVVDPLTRALWWSALHGLMRDGLVPAGVFVDMVIDQAREETDAGTLATLLAQARLAALRYACGQERGRLIALLAGDRPARAAAPGPTTDGWVLANEADPGSDAQLVRVRAWIAMAGHATELGPAGAEAAEDRLRFVLAGGIEGLVVGDDLRWRLCTALARLGRLTPAELEDQHRRDATATGAVRRLKAESSAPEPRVKAAVFTRILEERSASNDELDALIEGFAVDSHRHLTAAFTARYLEALEQVWDERDQEIATRIVIGLFPAAGGRDDLDRIESWLVDHPGAPAALRALIGRCRDDLARAVSVRGRGHVASGPAPNGMV